MPLLEDANPPPAARVVLGPYLTQTPDGQFDLRFRTNRRCVAGLRLGDDRRIWRFASGNIDHAIRLKTWTPEQGRRSQIWLDDQPGPVLSLRRAVQPGQPVSIAFAGTSKPSSLNMERAGRLLSQMSLDVMLLTAELFSAKATTAAWQETLFAPFNRVLINTPLYFPPGARRHVPRKLFPLQQAEEVAWRRTFGCVYLIALDARVLRHRSEAKLLLEWLDKALAAKPAQTVWTVLVLSQPLFTDQHVNARALQALDDRLERSGVHLVVSGGSPIYHRSLPLTMKGAGPVRYVVTAGLGREKEPTAGREYTAALSGQPHVGILSADQGRLSWQAVALDGRPIDGFDLDVTGLSDTAEGPPVAKEHILTDALALVTLRREILAVVRQACRAVPDPSVPQDLPMYIRNPSTRPFSGTIAWSVPKNTAWQVDPVRATFELKPGQAALLRTRITPAAPDGAVPQLVVESEGVGYSKQLLVVQKQRSAEVPLLSGYIRCDGRFSEAVWKKAAQLEGFTVLQTGKEPLHSVRCSVAALVDGLAIGIRSEAEQPQRFKTQARRRDAAVYKDESVEVLVDPALRSREYRQFAINVREVILDRSSLFGASWNPPWKHAVRFGRTDKDVEYYNTELLIPYRSLGLAARPRPGDRLALNIVRHDHHASRGKGKDKRLVLETVEWAPTEGSRFRSGCYGVVTFVKPKAKGKKKTERK